MLLRRKNAKKGVKSGLSKGEVYDTSIHQAAETPFKKCTVAVESPASSTWPPRAYLPKANDDQLRQRAQPASGSGPERPPRTRPPSDSGPVPVGLQENKRAERGGSAVPQRKHCSAGSTIKGTIHRRPEEEKGAEQSRRRRLAVGPSGTPGAERSRAKRRGAARPRTRA